MLMIFFFLMPMASGSLANLFLPKLLGVPEMVFPRLNNIGLLLLPLSYNFLVLSFVVDEGCGTGWTLYPPLAQYTSHAGVSVDCFIIAMHLSGLSTCFTASNVIATCA